MREILFRAFVPSEGDYYYIEKGNPCWLQLEGDKITLWEEYESWCSGSGEWTSSESIREIKDFVLEQYTGLKDKNGNKIFEGDRVLITGQGSIPDYEAIIYFELGRFAVKGKFCQDTSMIHFLSSETIEDFEIIGNIHEESK